MKKVRKTIEEQIVYMVGKGASPEFISEQMVREIEGHIQRALRSMVARRAAEREREATLRAQREFRKEIYLER